MLTSSCTVGIQTGPGYVSSGAAELEVNVDRPGSDYRSFDLLTPSPTTVMVRALLARRSEPC